MTNTSTQHGRSDGNRQRQGRQRQRRGSLRLTRVSLAIVAIVGQGALAGGTWAALTPAGPAAAALGSQTFNYVGFSQYFQVPEGITEILVEAWGAAGGDSSDGVPGGRGGYVRGFAQVLPGQYLEVNVGGKGTTSTSGAWNGGGPRGGGGWTVPAGGGGASDVRRGSSVADRLVVAGGGGGAAHSVGGHGGYPAGTRAGDNGLNPSAQGAAGGSGGVQNGGGFGGYGYCGVGAPGVAGNGGAGGWDGSGFAGGGGGGGFFGGGGGGAGCSYGGAGGGGGSSSVATTVTGAVYDVGAHYGHGKIVISWTPDAWATSLTTGGSLSEPTGMVSLDPIGREVKLLDTGIDNLGDSDVSTLAVPYQALPTITAPKEALVARLQPEIEYQTNLRSRIPDSPDEGICVGGCPPVTAQVSQPIAPMERYNWSGPAVTQLVLRQMRGTAPSQQQLADLEGTSKWGATSYDAIARTLNLNLPAEQFYWKVLSKGPSEYLAVVAAATHFERHGVINNVLTGPALQYWGDPITDDVKPARTYNITYGYSLNSGGVVYVAEPFDSTKANMPRSVNPYGIHTVPAADMYQAIMSNKGIVIW